MGEGREGKDYWTYQFGCSLGTAYLGLWVEWRWLNAPPFHTSGSMQIEEGLKDEDMGGSVT